MSVETQEELESIVGGIPGAVGADLTTYLNIYVKEHNLGTVFNADTEFELPGIGRRKPDIAFASFATVPEISSDAVGVPPDLAVEVVSKTDSTDDSDLKILEYRQASIKLVWVIRTVLKLIEIYHPGDEKPTVLGVSDTLKGENVVPGFELAVSKLFNLSNAKWRSPGPKK